MKTRCYNPNSSSYNVYGGKGIKICKEWLEDPGCFESWSLLNGYKNNLTIDRIDSNDDYRPENCQWITKSENSYRAAIKYPITVNSKTQSALEWSKELGVYQGHIGYLVKKFGEKEAEDAIKDIIANGYHNSRYYMITIGDKTQNAKEWALELGYNSSAISERIKRNGMEETIKFIEYCLLNGKPETTPKGKSVFVTINGITKNINQWGKELGYSHSHMLRVANTHGLEHAIKLIENTLSGTYKKPQSKTLTVNGISKSPTEWAKHFNTQDSYFRNLVLTKGEDFAIQQIKLFLKDPKTLPQNKNLITVNGKSLSARKWSKELGCSNNYITNIRRIKGYDAAVEYIQNVLNGTQQLPQKSPTHKITVNGVTKSALAWSNLIGRHKDYILDMLKKQGTEKTIEFLEKETENQNVLKNK